MPKRSPIISYGVIGLAAALAVAACGSSSKTSTSSGATTTTRSAAAPTTATGEAPLVKTKTDAKLGVILADASDKTLYTLTDNDKAVACTAGCPAVWPALTLPAGMTTPTGGPGVTGLGVATGPDGAQMVTVSGQPVYRFTKDGDAEDAYGEGIQSFGGTWHVVKAAGAATPASNPAAPTTTATRSGGGY